MACTRRMRAGPVALAVAALALAGCGRSGSEVGAASKATRAVPPGAWSPVRGGLLEEEIERLKAEGQDWDQIRAEIERLESIGYLAGSNAAHEEQGVTVHRADRTWEGLNLYVSGHAPEAILMDMDGAVLHRWSYPFEEAFPDAPPPPEGESLPYRAYFRRCHLDRDGRLLAIFEGYGMIALDRDSNLLWAHAGGEHHDADVLPDGRILTLARTAHLLERIHPTQPVLEDFVSVLSAEGVEEQRISVLEAFERSDFAHLLERCADSGDLLHTNSVTRLDGSHVDALPTFAAGNLLISCREIDTIAVLDPATATIVWAATGAWKAQHDPTLLDSGHILLFDNHGDDSGFGASRVLELDPTSGAIVWQFGGSEAAPIFSGTCGTTQRLPNGNTLLTESEDGRALEVDRDGAIVWEYVSPHRPPTNRELVALLFDLQRLPLDFAANWLR